MMARTWYIYGLAEPEGRPDAGLIRYVGRTIRVLTVRLREHLKYSVQGDTHLGRWLRKLRAAGMTPSPVIFEQGIGDEVDDAERWYIAWWAYSGQLVNHTVGGDGLKLSGSTTGEETRRKLSVATKARWKNPAYRMETARRLKSQMQNPENRRKIGNAVRAAWLNPVYREKRTERLQENIQKMRAAVTKRKPTDTVHLLSCSRIFHGDRARAWVLIRDGMTVRELVAACAVGGLDVRPILSKFVHIYRCIEIREGATP